MRARVAQCLLATVAVAAVVAGCSLSSSTMSALGGANDSANPATPGDNGDVNFSGGLDAAADGSRAPETLPGTSPLCYAHSFGDDCFPDGPRTSDVQCVDMMGTAADDGGSGSGSGGTGSGDAAVSGACRVRVDSQDGQPKPTCIAPTGGGNDGCIVSTDCAAGYECVGSPGQCRHYCCDPTSCTAEQQFCDIQTMAEQGSLRVPVCMPVRSCKLLSTTGCVEGETCAVVDDLGTTSCVAVGPAKVGESCDTTHCGANLTCIGVVGARKCYKLCDMTRTECATGEQCKASALVKEPSIGICKRL